MTSDLADLLAAARALLFVPGDRPERFEKAARSGADLVVMDLEDAVAPPGKGAAREHVSAALDTGVAYGVRVNALGTPWFDEDLRMVSGHACVVVLPKAEHPAAVMAVSAALSPGSVILALIETAVGVLTAPAIAGADRVGRLAFGSFDLADELGVSPDEVEALAPSRGQLVLASAAAGLPAPVDGVTAAVGDEEALTRDITRAWRTGFTGKLCVHPRQVGPVCRLLSPSEGDVAWASGVLDATSGQAEAVLVVDGRMVDRPVVRRAQRIMARHRLFDTGTPGAPGTPGTLG